MPPAVRLSDKAAIPADAHGCPACPHPAVGPTVNGSPNVMINKLPAIRLGDPGIHAACCGPNQYKTAKGSPTVYVNGKPLCRMGDKTAHCGGSGNLINGSPNVFADDGGGGGSKLSALQARALAARDELLGKYDAKKKDKKGNWDGKDGKGKGRKGDGDLSSDEAKKNSADVLAAKFDDKTAAPETKVAFTIECGAACVGPVQLEICDKDGKVLTKTSVDAKPEAKGSFKAPKLPKGKSRLDVTIKAKKGGKTVESEEPCTIAEGGLVIRLYDEKRGEDDPTPDNPNPTNARADTTELVKGKIQASVKLKTDKGQKSWDVTFEDGIAFVPETKVQGAKPAGKPGKGGAYADGAVSVTFKGDAVKKFKDYKVRAFNPPSKTK